MGSYQSSYIHTSTQMPNPKGNPDNLQPLSTDREHPLTQQLSLRVSEPMMNKLKSIDNYREFVRAAIQNALDKLDATD